MIRTDVELRRYDDPFLFYVGDDLLSPETLKELNATIPDRALYSREIKLGSTHRKQYKMWRCEPGLDSARTTVADQLTEPWSNLVDSALSTEFRTWLSDAVQIDIRPCPTSIGLYIFEDGDYTTIDTGKKEKALTLGLYLNEQWSTAYGGLFQTFTAKDPTLPPVQQIVPVGGRCVTWTPTDTSWHRIDTVNTGDKVNRLLMMMEFWRP